MDPQAGVYKAKKIEGPLPEYDAMRARVGQRIGADTQQQQDAMQRRFAAQGGLNSGASIKQQQLIADQGVQRREEGIQGIDQQESAERRRLTDLEGQKEFQSQEAAAGRDFAAGESRLGREFQAAEAQKQRDLQGSQFDKSFGLDQQKMGLAQKEFDRDSDTLAFNRGLSALESGNPDELMKMMERFGGPGGAPGGVQSLIDRYAKITAAQNAAQAPGPEPEHGATQFNPNLGGNVMWNSLIKRWVPYNTSAE